ncbi:uncharacterized protein RAG0_11384 [Rhynchosporium agropyri]|uniref:Uncharacterized protein n=1 Tax=Rhynchosporium agropyri TaxID=914238 RepID=A0A1E1L3V1_9HELO|nr:uncharacterized protein RAG0_11384 [Rhynchosporium agropyri]
MGWITDLHDLARPELKEGLRVFLDLGQRAARDAREENAGGLENGRGEALEEEQRHPTVSSTSLYLLKKKAAPHFKNIWTSSPSSRTDTSSQSIEDEVLNMLLPGTARDKCGTWTMECRKTDILKEIEEDGEWGVRGYLGCGKLSED